MRFTPLFALSQWGGKSRLIGTVLILEALALVLNAPLGILRALPGLLAHMPALDVATDWAILALAVSLLNLGAAVLAAITGRIAELCGLGKDKVDRLVFGACIVLYVLSTCLMLLAELPPGTLSGKAKLAVGCAIALGTSFIVAFASDAGTLRRKITRIGAAAALALPVLLAAVLAAGVRIVSFPDIRTPPVAGVKAAPDSPNIIVVIADALSAHAMSLYGNPLPTTPRLDRLAMSGTVVIGYTAASNFTVPTTATILSGQYPNHHGVTSLSSYYVDHASSRKRLFLPQMLRNGGYKTIGFIGNPNGGTLKLRIQEQFDLSSLESHDTIESRYFFTRMANSNIESSYILFPIIEQALRLLNTLEPRKWVDQDPPNIEYDRALDWLDHERNQRQPFFLWLHTIPPHAPYLPPSPHRKLFDHSDRYLDTASFAAIGPWFYDPGIGRLPDADIRTLQNRYYENVHYADDRFAAFFEALRARGLLKNTIVIFTADHGETFKRWIAHGGPYLDGDLIDVPLVVWGPGIQPGARLVQRSSQVDLAPTLLDFAAVKSPVQMDGRSLRGALESGSPLPPKTIYSMQLEQSATLKPPQNGTLAIIDRGWKYVYYLQNRKAELFDTTASNRSDADVLKQHPAVGEKLRRDLFRYYGLPLQ